MSKVDKYTERGIAFLEGDGVAKDYEQAFYWLSAAYELGSSKAETILCDMRAKSLGAPFDGDVPETASLDDGPDACGVTTGTQTVAVSNVRADESRPANPNRCIACGEEALVPSEAFAGAKHCSPSRGGCGTNVMIPIVEDGLARGVALQPYREPIPGRQENTYSSLGSLIHMIKYDTRVDDALKAVGMYEYRMHAPNQLSGGQKQRIAIAGIIAMRPSCIVLDEPTAMLDPKGRMEVMKTIRMLNRSYGITIVLITHYMEEAAQADRVIVMDDGNILLDDRPEEVFSHVEQMKAIGLDVPQVTELVYELRQQGIPLDSHIISEDAGVEAILQNMA